MRTPTIHRNGTSSTTLMENFEEAGRALRKAIEAVGQAAPNGRDYYPQGEGAISEATREHTSRLDRLHSVLREIQELHESVAGA